mmetsp:Transcript_13665/g.57836  ORF Transcript_13665/g.57836 Transcript_13665/m.57836 type:complete len:221 (+) Transcript_13665:706-1368(+)
MRSKRESRVGGSWMLSTTLMAGLYLDPTGFADASTEVLALRTAMMPALAIETVCCSITSCRVDRAPSLILSNSSMQQMPRSDKTSAPDSSTMSFVSGSLCTYAVRPTADEPLPDVYIPRGATLLTYVSSCDFETPGSPTRMTLRSPRTLFPEVEPLNVLLVAPNSWHSKPFLTSSISHILGARDATSRSYMSPFLPMASNSAMRSSMNSISSLGPRPSFF